MIFGVIQTYPKLSTSLIRRKGDNIKSSPFTHSIKMFEAKTTKCRLVSRTDSGPRGSQFTVRVNRCIGIESSHHHVIDHAVTLTFMPHTNLSFFVGGVCDLHSPRLFALAPSYQHPFRQKPHLPTQFRLALCSCQLC